MRTANHPPAPEGGTDCCLAARRELLELQSIRALDAVKAEIEGGAKARPEEVEIVERRGALAGVELSPYMKLLLLRPR